MCTYQWWHASRRRRTTPFNTAPVNTVSLSDFDLSEGRVSAHTAVIRGSGDLACLTHFLGVAVLASVAKSTSAGDVSV
jgi:hypothetical protein